MRNLFFLLLICCVGQTALTADQSPLFEADVLPILQAKCGDCHSHKVRKGDLNLAEYKGLLRGGESGESAIAESADDSMLWIMIDGGGMPPEDKPQLTDGELSLIRKWLESGAPAKEKPQLAEASLNQHDILPILLLRCSACHGKQRQDGDLDLHTIAGLKTGGESGPAFVARDPDQSLMIQRIESEACPPQQLLLKFFVRRPPESEVDKLKEWIAAGTPEEEIQPDVATAAPDPLVTEEDRQHWAFQPPTGSPGDHSVDEFIESRLSEHELTLSPPADRDTLIRRAFVDLIGMPPSPAEWKRWHDSTDSDWYRKMVNELLASPHYGERWGRYWLDLAGYADSEGGVSADPVRAVAWKYRDYVIESFNEDKPYDRFLLEQLAGDELIDYEHAPEITDEIVENLVATGFLRMGIDQTGSRTMNFVPERLGVIDDALRIVGEGLMGLTVGCARCHSHKYDPFPQRDYYRLKATFKGAFDEYDWLSFKNRSLNLGTAEQRQRVAEINPPLLKELKQLQADERQTIKALQYETLHFHYPDQSDAENDETIAALKIADNNRTLPQRILVEKLVQAELLPEEQQSTAILELRERLAEIQLQITRTQEQMAPPVQIRALWDRGEPSPTYILKRGEHDQPGRLVGPGVPAVLNDGESPFEASSPFPDGTEKTGRRLAFAKWLTNPDHPLTSRVMVNRIWYHHFGSGLVKSLENFGVKGEPPTHPELLDWLAVEFVNRGWSIKEMHRLIMNSHTYKQSSTVRDEHLEHDPANELLSRMPLRRMNAEAIRDSLLLVSGRLDDNAGGPPDGISVDREGFVSVNPKASGNWRRSIYAQYRRTEIPTMMETFDYPEMGPNCIARSTSTVSPQSLLLLNNDRVRELAESFATRMETKHGQLSNSNVSAIVDAVFVTALSRLPSPEEREASAATLEKLQLAWHGDAHSALVSFCHTILNSAAFAYID